MKINEIGWKISEEDRDVSSKKIGKLVKKNEMGDPKARTSMKKVETGDMKVEEFVKKIHMNEPKVGKIGKSARFGQEEYTKFERGVMLAELLWQVVKQAREQELKYLRELDVYDKVDEHAVVANTNRNPFTNCCQRVRKVKTGQTL